MRKLRSYKGKYVHKFKPEDYLLLLVRDQKYLLYIKVVESGKERNNIIIYNITPYPNGDPKGKDLDMFLDTFEKKQTNETIYLLDKKEAALFILMGVDTAYKVLFNEKT